MKKIFRRLINAVCVPPFAPEIPLDLATLRDKSVFSLLWRSVRPWLVLFMYRQTSLQQETIGKQQTRLLWIYKGSPQIGDSLMDLSSRVFLKNTGLQIDLYTDPHLADLFGADDIFSRVFSDAREISASRYDLVIVDSFKARCLRVKISHARKLPFVTMRGYFSGPEFNRTLFSFHRMNQLLDLRHPAETISALAIPCLSGSAQDRKAVKPLSIASDAIGFAIGGAEPARTCQYWDKVISKLFEQGKISQAVMLGSENGRGMGEKIIAASGVPAHRIINCIDRYSLTQTFEIIKKCRFIVCCDGALLHMANAARVPTVALFDRHVSPAMRLTSANPSIPLQSEGTISDLPEHSVMNAIDTALSVYTQAQ